MRSRRRRAPASPQAPLLTRVQTGPRGGKALIHTQFRSTRETGVMERPFFLFCNRTVPSIGRTRPRLLPTGLLAAARGAPLHRDGGVSQQRFPSRGAQAPGSRAQQLRPGLWDPPRPGTEPVSPASAGGFSLTGRQGSPRRRLYSALSFGCRH